MFPSACRGAAAFPAPDDDDDADASSPSVPASRDTGPRRAEAPSPDGVVRWWTGPGEADRSRLDFPTTSTPRPGRDPITNWPHGATPFWSDFPDIQAWVPASRASGPGAPPHAGLPPEAARLARFALPAAEARELAQRFLSLPACPANFGLRLRFVADGQDALADIRQAADGMRQIDLWLHPLPTSRGEAAWYPNWLRRRGGPPGESAPVESVHGQSLVQSLLQMLEPADQHALIRHLSSGAGALAGPWRAAERLQADQAGAWPLRPVAVIRVPCPVPVAVPVQVRVPVPVAVIVPMQVQVPVTVAIQWRPPTSMPPGHSVTQPARLPINEPMRSPGRHVVVSARAALSDAPSAPASAATSPMRLGSPSSPASRPPQDTDMDAFPEEASLVEPVPTRLLREHPARLRRAAQLRAAATASGASPLAELVAQVRAQRHQSAQAHAPRVRARMVAIAPEARPNREPEPQPGDRGGMVGFVDPGVMPPQRPRSC